MKKYSAELLFIVLLIICINSNINAQISFSKEYGGQYNEDGRWMEQMPDSGFIMTGGTATYSNGQTDIWLVRTDAYGNTKWTKSIGGPYFDFANMVKILPDGFIISGVTNRNGSDDAYLIKTDKNGNELWSKIVGDSGTQWFEAAIPTTDHGFAAVGVNTSGTNGHYDIYLVKFDSLGNTIWQKNIGGQSYEIGNSIQQTSDGGYIITGQTYSYGNYKDGDYYLVKTDASGNVMWQRTFEQPHLQEAHYVQITPDGGYIIVGDADTLPNGLGNTDIWMIKTDSNGNMLWDQVYGGSKKDGGKTVENTSDGGFIIAGITRSFNLINPNYYLVKTSGTGALQWQLTSYGTAYHDHAYRAVETSDGGFAEFGYFRNSSNAMNFALVKLGPGGGVNKDISIDKITAPSSKLCASYNVSLAVQLTNYGEAMQQNIPVNLIVSNGTTTSVFSDTLYGTILPDSSAILNFSSTYDFISEGNYSITAYINHLTGDISYTNDTNSTTVTVLSPTADPVPANGLLCSSGSLNLSVAPASSADSVFWYDANQNGNLVSTGKNYSTPVLNNSATYYVQSVKGKGSMTGAPNFSMGAGGYNNNGYLNFDSRVPFKLVSVLVYTSSAGNRTIELRNSAGTVLQSKTVNLPVANAGIRVYLNFDVPEGNDLELGLSATSANLFRNSSGANFPYSVSQTVEIYGSSSSNSGYYYYFYNWYVFVPSQNCASNMIPVNAIISNDGVTNAMDASRCGTGTVNLQMTSNSSVQWYDSATGGNLLNTGNSFVTPIISSTTSYFAQVATCPNRTEVKAFVNAISSSPVTTDVTRCGPGTVTFNASSNDTVFWYSNSNLSLLAGTGSAFTSPSLNSTTTYYAVAGVHCPSNPVTVQAIINTTAPPAVSDAAACGPASVTLTAVSPDPVRWYLSASGGNPVATGSTFSTPVLSNPVYYYAEAGSTCPSVRVQVNANIIMVDAPVGTGAARCGAGTIVLSAQSLNPVTWWTQQSGGTQVGSGLLFTTGNLNATTVYYAMSTLGNCSSQRAAVTASVINTPAPVTSNVVHCGTGSLTLQASSPYTINWYDSPSGGNQLSTGSSFVTPVISSTTTYYVQAISTCSSARVPVVAFITSQAADPVVSNSARCGSGSASINAVSSLPVSWYDAPGGNLLSSGNTFITPSISSTTTYFAVAGSPGCYSNAVPAVVQINSIPVAPATSGNSNCGPGNITLNAVSSNPVYWYDAPGGNQVGSGTGFTTPVISSTTTYYASSVNNGCYSSAVAAVAVINPLPPAPNVNGAGVCSSGSMTLSASSPDPVQWYDAPGGNLIATGSYFTTPFLSSTSTYYVTAGSNCKSNPVPVVASVYALPQPPNGTNSSSCNPAQLSLNASSSGIITWYNQAVGGSVIGNGSTYSSYFTGNTTVYAETFDGKCSSIRTAVTAFIYTPPVVNLGPPVISINSGQSVILDAGPGYLSYLWNTSATSQTIQVSTQGNYSVTVIDNHGCSGTGNVTVNVITGINHLAESDFGGIYPNPATDHFNVILNKPQEIARLEFTDVAGQILFTDLLSGNPVYKNYSLTSFSPGLYFVRIYSGEKVIVKPLVHK